MRVVNALLRNRGVRWGLVVVVAFFLVFEVTVRHLPPDDVTVTTINYVEMSGHNTVTTTSRTTSADTAQTRAAIDRLSDALNTAPIGGPSIPIFTHGCMTAIGYTEYRVTFTWHGLPVQVWTTNTPCPNFTENSGGIPDLLWSRTLLWNGQQSLNALR